MVNFLVDEGKCQQCFGDPSLFSRCPLEKRRGGGEDAMLCPVLALSVRFCRNISRLLRLSRNHFSDTTSEPLSSSFVLHPTSSPTVSGVTETARARAAVWAAPSSRCSLPSSCWASPLSGRCSRLVTSSTPISGSSPTSAGRCSPTSV